MASQALDVLSKKIEDLLVKNRSGVSSPLAVLILNDLSHIQRVLQMMPNKINLAMLGQHVKKARDVIDDTN